MTEDKKNQALTPMPLNPLVSSDIIEKNDEALCIYDLIRKCYSQSEIRSMYPEWKQKKFNSVWEQAMCYTRSNVKDVEDARAIAVTRLEYFLQLAIKAGNIKEARNIQDSLSKIQGLTRDITIQGEFVTAWK